MKHQSLIPYIKNYSQKWEDEEVDFRNMPR